MYSPMKTIDFSYFIEKYITGEMNQIEKKWFEKEIEGNESLKKEVLLRKKADLILERYDIVSLRQKLVSIEKSKKDELKKNKKLTSSGFRYAAIFTGLVVVGSLLFLSFKHQSPETIYKRYYQVYNTTGSTRSAETSYNDAIDYFNKKEFAKALAGFQAYLKQNPGSLKFEFLSGISNMEIRNFNNAELSFNKIIKKEGNLYVEDANWYLAMCYIATNDIAMARYQLRKIVMSESFYKSKAKKILRHL
jgi:TolA-binding protein